MTMSADDGFFHVGPTLETLGDGPGVVVEEEGGFVSSGQEPAPQQQPQAQEPEEQPEPRKLAGKYDTPEDLEKAYAELQKAYSKATAKPKAQPTEQEQAGAETSEDGDAEEAEEAPEATPEQPAKVNVEAITAEWQETGELSEDSLASLEAVGIDRDMATLFFAGIEAIQVQRAGALHEAAGSAEEYNNIVKWGTQNLSKEEQAAFNAAIDTAILEGDPAAAKLIIGSVKARMGGSEPRYVDARNAPGAGIEPFASMAEVSKAMSDPRYRTDGAYVAQVQKRLAISNVM